MKNYKLCVSSWDSKEVEVINRVIHSGNYKMGTKVKEFEDNFAKYHNSKHCVMVNSGSSANLLAVASLFYTKKPKLKRGDEVIVPALSWATTYSPLYQYGLKIKFIDIDLETLNFDLNQLKKAISPKTKMIFAVNILGNPNNFDEINDIIKGKDIILLEDNCESMGAEYKGKKTGTFGLMGTFSTFFSHHISTMEGGLILTEDTDIYNILLSIRNHGWTRHLNDETKVQNFDNYFNFILPGYNLRPLEMSGAVGIEQLKKLPVFLKNRRDNAKYFCKTFENNKDFYIQKEISSSSWFGFSLIIKPNSNLNRGELIKKLHSEKVEYRPIVSGDFTKQKVIKYFDYEIYGKLNNVKYLNDNGLFLGNHNFDIKDKFDLLKKVLI